jgi:hypothetical protein
MVANALYAAKTTVVIPTCLQHFLRQNLNFKIECVNAPLSGKPVPLSSF